MGGFSQVEKCLESEFLPLAINFFRGSIASSLCVCVFFKLQVIITTTIIVITTIVAAKAIIKFSF